jgi:hypothetical protein
MSTEFQYDVFLSHNSADKPRVRELAVFAFRLAAGHHPGEPVAICDLEQA